MLAIALAVLLISDPSPNAAAIAEVREQITADQQRPALLKIAKLLKGENVTPYERYDLLMMRGQALLNLKQKPAAIQAFNDAAAVSRQDDDLARPACARATVTLLRKAQGLSYRSGGEEIPLLTVDDRRRAMAALMADLLPDVRKSVDQAMRQDTLVPIENLMPDLGDVYCLELAGTGKTDRTLPLVQDLGGHARRLIDAELARLNYRIVQLNEISTDLAWLDNNIMYKRGLTSPEQNEVAAMIPYLERIQGMAREARRVNIRIGGTGESWEKIIADCDDLAARADALLAAVGPRR